MNPIELNIFESQLSSVCDEMGAVLRNSAFSPNIRDRLDFSCAIFDEGGELCAQAAHIPVHLGSMAFAMKDVVSRITWHPGDQVILNDPYLGGTHLPDVTVIAPVFAGEELAAFVVNRAHHADIGASAPGSMPLSRHLDEEGLLLSPVHLWREGVQQKEIWQRLLASTKQSHESAGDFSAQVAANNRGSSRLSDLIQDQGLHQFRQGLAELNDYAERLATKSLSRIPDGNYSFQDYLDDDGQGQQRIHLCLSLNVHKGQMKADFSGTAQQVEGNVNCPLSVTAAGVYYVFRCLMPAQTPACAGAFRSISLKVPKGSLLNAAYPAAVAAGNVETSMRVVDLVMGALSKAMPDLIPAASQGTMNNIAMGSAVEPVWDYYETLGGGMGGGPEGGGLSGIHTHMTNTLNTPIEVLETRYPIRLIKYRLRRGSGGEGKRYGGDGLIREFEFQQASEVSLLTERREISPWGIAGGQPGQCGQNYLNDEPIAAKCHVEVNAGDRIRIETPGGGGWGKVD